MERLRLSLLIMIAAPSDACVWRLSLAERVPFRAECGDGPSALALAASPPVLLAPQYPDEVDAWRFVSLASGLSPKVMGRPDSQRSLGTSAPPFKLCEWIC